MSDTQNTPAAPATPRERPLSPHLQVYKLPMTALMSISHRISGVILSGGLLLVFSYIIAAAQGPSVYSLLQQYAGLPVVSAFFFLWSFILYFHLFSGVRHLIWDTGRGIDKKQAEFTGWLVLVAAAFSTAMTWYCVGQMQLQQIF